MTVQQARRRGVLLLVVAYAAIAGLMVGAPAASAYTVDTACSSVTPFGWSGSGQSAGSRYSVSLCRHFRSDGYIWATEQYYIDGGHATSGAVATFTGAITLWVQDCSTGRDTNATSVHSFAKGTPDRAYAVPGGQAPFTSIGTKIGNGVAGHSYRVIARFSHGVVAGAGRSPVYTDVARGSSFGDAPSPCSTVHGAPAPAVPSAPGARPALGSAKRVSPTFERAEHAAFVADPGSQIVRDKIGGDGDDGLIVMRFFIPSKLAALACLKGDGRSFDSNPLLSAMFAGHARSRVVLAWDTSTGEIVFKVMESEEHDCKIANITKTGRKLPAVPLTRYKDCAGVANDPGVDKPRNHQDVFLSTFRGDSLADPSGLDVCLSVVNPLTNTSPVGAFSVDSAFRIIPANGLSPDLVHPSSLHTARSAASFPRTSPLPSHDATGTSAPSYSPVAGGYAIQYTGQGYPAIEAYYYPRYIDEGGPYTIYRRINDPRPPRNPFAIPGIPGWGSGTIGVDGGGGDGALTSMARCDKLDVNATHVHCTPYPGIKHMHPWDTDWSAHAGGGGGGGVVRPR